MHSSELLLNLTYNNLNHYIIHLVFWLVVPFGALSKNNLAVTSVHCSNKVFKNSLLRIMAPKHQPDDSQNLNI